MAQFERGFWIVMEGTGGELDRKFVKGGNAYGMDEGAALAIAMGLMVKEIGILGAGDTFRVEEGESEAVE